MLCDVCKKHEAVERCQQFLQGKKTIKYLCLECYQRLMITLTPETSEKADVCPHCGMTSEELKKRNVVGCAECYTVFARLLNPVIVKMQGGQKHCGKKPQGSETDRIARRTWELKALVDVCNAENDFDAAEEYTRRLGALQSGEEEGDYAWKKYLHLSKKS